jgi:hypothetical protein
MFLKYDDFRMGTIPGRHPRKLPPGYAQTKDNCTTWTGSLVPLKNWSSIGTLGKAGVIKSVYKYEDTYWFHWTDDTDVAKGPFAGDTSARTYFTVNDGNTTKPQVTDNLVGPGGGAFVSQPLVSYNMGVAAPTAAPTVLESGGTCSSAEKVTRIYAYSFVDSMDRESDMSPASAGVDVCADSAVTLSAMDISAGAGYNITKQKIYRLVTGTTTSTYKLVATQSVATGYVDTVADADLGAAAFNEGWLEPPDNMGGFIVMPNEMGVGFSGFDVYVSVKGQLHAYPHAYRLAADYEIVALAAFGQSILVGTKGTPYIITGIAPGNMSMDRIQGLNQACVSKRSMVYVDGAGVIYASPDGLVMVSEGVQGVITEGIINQDEWSAYVPADIDGYTLDGRYYGFSSGGAFIFDPSKPELGFTSITGIDPTAGFYDYISGNLYLQDGEDDLMQFGAGSDLTLTWKSPVETLSKPECPQMAQVRAESYSDTTLKLYMDGVLKATKSVKNGDPFKWYDGSKAQIIEIEVTGTDEVTEIIVADCGSRFANG